MTLREKRGTIREKSHTTGIAAPKPTIEKQPFTSTTTASRFPPLLWTSILPHPHLLAAEDNESRKSMFRQRYYSAQGAKLGRNEYRRQYDLEW